MLSLWDCTCHYIRRLHQTTWHHMNHWSITSRLSHITIVLINLFPQSTPAAKMVHLVRVDSHRFFPHTWPRAVHSYQIHIQLHDAIESARNTVAVLYHKVTKPPAKQHHHRPKAKEIFQILQPHAKPRITQPHRQSRNHIKIDVQSQASMPAPWRKQDQAIIKLPSLVASKPSQGKPSHTL